MDIERNTRELIRWYVLIAIYSGRPYPVAEPLILSAIQTIPIECTAMQLRRELDYLRDRKLVDLKTPEGAPWIAELTRDGVDVVEYTVECDAGIARPKKYW